MKKRILFVLTMCCYLVACSGAPIAPAGSALAGCKKQLPWFCRGKQHAPTVYVNTTAGKLRASPYCTQMIPGTKLVFRLYPAGNQAMGAVEIIPKNDTHSWLEVKNDVYQDLIIVDIPTTISPTAKYYFGVKTPTDCVDPRVKVDH